MEDNNTAFEIVKKGNKSYNLKYKIIIVGDPGVGKTCICVKHTKNSFANEYIQTYGYSNFISDLKYKNVEIKLELFDTSGDDQYDSLIKALYRNASLVIIVYSIAE